MNDRTPRSTDAIAPEAEAVLAWEEARTRLAAADSYWVTTVRPDGSPHVRPVLAVWVDGAVYSTTNAATRKGRNLAGDSRCVVSAGQDGLDLVVEGYATFVRDDDTLQRVAQAYETKYDWPLTIRDGAFDAPYAAPTAGEGPYHAYEITPTVVYGFATTERLGTTPATRWRF